MLIRKKKVWAASTGDFVVVQRKLSGSGVGRSHRIKDEGDAGKGRDDTCTVSQLGNKQ